jgi:hypothetical protein
LNKYNPPQGAMWGFPSYHFIVEEELGKYIPGLGIVFDLITIEKD